MATNSTGFKSCFRQTTPLKLLPRAKVKYQSTLECFQKRKDSILIGYMIQAPKYK